MAEPTPLTAPAAVCGLLVRRFGTAGLVEGPLPTPAISFPPRNKAEDYGRHSRRRGDSAEGAPLVTGDHRGPTIRLGLGMVQRGRPLLRRESRAHSPTARGTDEGGPGHKGRRLGHLKRLEEVAGILNQRGAAWHTAAGLPLLFTELLGRYRWHTALYGVTVGMHPPGRCTGNRGAH
ncbi:hypothetical protein NDU88_003602 [Pleurodeles waltl]|uniref:Uncharacterized protein n=1 Tax=Pleurodeles waltl TaxID=8319 RepID=A0AAV7LSH6_PLEWA|nr:hypothetical protein NDU88_003602 [Pleurodeles waltl]